MSRKIKYWFIISLAAIFHLFSCKKETSCENCKGNKPPIAIAGPDQVITLPTDSALLDGSSSSDPDGTIRNWLWNKISGPASFLINNSSASNIVAKNLVKGVYQFELEVTDNAGLSAKDTIQIIVNDAVQPNRPPVANAGDDRTINLPINNVAIDGSGSTDPDNNIMGYAWTKISGPSSFSISNANAIQTQITSLVVGVYQFELKVTDAGGLFSKDTLQVIVTNQPCSQPGTLPTVCDNSTRPQICAQLIPFGTLSLAGDRMVVASAGNKIVFAGRDCCPGSSRVDIYDMVTQTWSIAELSVARWGIAAVASGNKIFFAGGEVGDGAFDLYYSTVDIYDVSTNTWSVAWLSEPRSEIAAAAVGNKVLFAGGEKDMSYNTSDKVDIYDIPSNTWSTTTLSEPRSFISAVTANNKIYFAGGHKEDRWFSALTNRIDIYDNATGTWSTSSLIEPKGCFAGVAVANKIYWAGGFKGGAGQSNSCQVEIRDVITQSSSVNSLFRPGCWWTDFGENVVIKNNKIVFFRGGWFDSGDINKFDIYDIQTQTWSIGVLDQNIQNASLISVNNTIYVAGGYVNGVASNQVWKLEF